MTRARRVLRLAPLAALATLYLVFASCHIGDPLTNDEVWEFHAAQKLHDEGRATTVTGELHTHHPYGYYFVQGASQALLGRNEVGARAVGILATLLCLIVMLRMLAVLRGGFDAFEGALLAGLYLLSPMAIQGSLIITADTGVHHLAIALFLLVHVERYPYRPADRALCTALCAAMFWVKLVTPALVAGSVVLFFLARREWREAAAALATGAGGFLLFLGTWWLYCVAAGVPALAVFEYLGQVAESRTAVTAASKSILLARHGLTLLVWLSIPFAALMAMSARASLRSRSRSMLGLLVVVGLVLALAHTVISGVTIGYPRYHFSMLPIWSVAVCCVAADAFRTERIPWARLSAAGAAALAWYLFVAGDPLDSIAFELKLRSLAIDGVAAPALPAIAGTLALGMIPPAGLLAGALRRRDSMWLARGLVVVTLASFLALDIHQARADYLTGYSYGERGTSEAIAYVGKHLATGREIVACKDLVFHTSRRGYMQDWRWTDRDYILARLSSATTQFAVMGIQQTTADQLRRMWLDPDFVEALRAYHRIRIGSYFIWERTDPATAAIRYPEPGGHGSIPAGPRAPETQ